LPTRHRQKETAAGCLALHFATDIVGHLFRENALAASLSGQRLQFRQHHHQQPIESFRGL